MKVIEVSKQLFPTMASAFHDARLNLIIGDAAKYVTDYNNDNSNKELYDVIIVDSSDPVGPADVLFQETFFNSLSKILNPVNGIICTQGECQWLHLDLIAQVKNNISPYFQQVKYAYSMVPSYPSGQLGFLLFTKNKDLIINEPSRAIPEDFPTRYYTKEMHSAAFVLPKFVRDKLQC